MATKKSRGNDGLEWELGESDRAWRLRGRKAIKRGRQTRYALAPKRLRGFQRLPKFRSFLGA